MIKQNLMGIYALSCDFGEGIYYYVGHAGYNGIAKRNSYWMSEIKKGKCRYEIFNEAYRRDPSSIHFEILYTVEDKNELADLEYFYINRYFANVEGAEVVNKNKNKSGCTIHSKFKSTEKMKLAQLWSHNGNARLSESQAGEVLWLRNNSDMTHVQIANKYSISSTHVGNIGNLRWIGVEEVKPEWYKEDGDNNENI